jgi:hypothetical protein
MVSGNWDEVRGEMRTKEHILEDDGLLGEAEEIAVVRFIG